MSWLIERPKTRAFSGRFGREKRVEHLLFYVRRHTGSVVGTFHTIAKVSGRGRESRLVVGTISLSSALGRSIECVCNQIKKSPPDVLRKNVRPSGRRIKGLLELDLKTLRFGPCSVPSKIKAVLNESIRYQSPDAHLIFRASAAACS